MNRLLLMVVGFARADGRAGALPSDIPVDMGVDLRGRNIRVASISWTARRSAPPSSRCVANEWRKVCGCTSFLTPAFLAYAWTIFQIAMRVIGLPRAFRNSMSCEASRRRRHALQLTA
jgi:hypothetical protein